MLVYTHTSFTSPSPFVLSPSRQKPQTNEHAPIASTIQRPIPLIPRQVEGVPNPTLLPCDLTSRYLFTSRVHVPSASPARFSRLFSTSTQYYSLGFGGKFPHPRHAQRMPQPIIHKLIDTYGSFQRDPSDLPHEVFRVSISSGFQHETSANRSFTYFMLFRLSFIIVNSRSIVTGPIIHAYVLN